MDFWSQVWKRVWEMEYFLVWNWVWIWRCGRHTPTKNSKEYPPPPPAADSLVHMRDRTIKKSVNSRSFWWACQGSAIYITKSISPLLWNPQMFGFSSMAQKFDVSKTEISVMIYIFSTNLHPSRHFFSNIFFGLVSLVYQHKNSLDSQNFTKKYLASYCQQVLQSNRTKRGAPESTQCVALLLNWGASFTVNHFSDYTRDARKYSLC